MNTYSCFCDLCHFVPFFSNTRKGSVNSNRFAINLDTDVVTPKILRNSIFLFGFLSCFIASVFAASGFMPLLINTWPKNFTEVPSKTHFSLYSLRPFSFRIYMICFVNFCNFSFVSACINISFIETSVFTQFFNSLDIRLWYASEAEASPKGRCSNEYFSHGVAIVK